MDVIIVSRVASFIDGLHRVCGNAGLSVTTKPAISRAEVLKAKPNVLVLDSRRLTCNFSELHLNFLRSKGIETLILIDRDELIESYLHYGASHIEVASEDTAYDLLPLILSLFKVSIATREIVELKRKHQ